MSVQQPTKKQRVYYTWLVLKRARFVVASCSRRELSARIEDLYNANTRDGMIFNAMNDEKREHDMTVLLEWLAREDDQEGTAS